MSIYTWEMMGEFIRFPNMNKLKRKRLKDYKLPAGEQSWFFTKSIINEIKYWNKEKTKIEYVTKHSENGTTFSADLTLSFNNLETNPQIHYTLDMGELTENLSVEESLDKLANWLERTSKAIRNRKAPTKQQLTVY